MKAIKIKLRDPDTGCFVCWWTARRVPRAWNCGGNLPHPRYVSGWSFTTHDGVERFAEGDWSTLVESVRLTAGNYGLLAAIS